jgi:TatD DNase family protein
MSYPIIDTHCHLYLNEFASNRTALIDRTKQAGVQHIFLPAIDSSSFSDLLALEQFDPTYFHAMTGLHPCYVNETMTDELAFVEKQLAARAYVAIGECGLDFHWDTTFAKEQVQALEQQAQWALQYDVPIILHTRKATAETIAVMKQFPGIRGIFHCFGGTLSEAEQIIAMGFYLGIGGVLTYKNAGLDQLVEALPLSHLVLETDAPYLTPVPHRGKRNEPSFLPIILEKLASVKQCPVSEVAAMTTQNALNLFFSTSD